MSAISPAAAALTLPAQPVAATQKLDSDGDRDNSPKTDTSNTTSPSRALNVLA